MAYDGKSYGVPYAVENVALLTNPELSPECPASLDDLISQGEALLKDKKASLPLALQIGDKGDAYHWYPLYSANGGYIFGENADGTTNVEDMGVGQAGSIAAAESLQEMADKKLHQGLGHRRHRQGVLQQRRLGLVHHRSVERHRRRRRPSRTPWSARCPNGPDTVVGRSSASRRCSSPPRRRTP